MATGDPAPAFEAACWIVPATGSYGGILRKDLTALPEQYYPPPPVQKPRIPLWVVGMWPKKKSMRRVLKCDGLIPNKINPDGKPGELTPGDIREMKAFVDANRSLSTPFDIIVEGKTVGLDAAQTAAKLAPWAEAGATWWMETLYDVPREVMLARLRQGPPRLA